jgi:hypothetical protein
VGCRQMLDHGGEAALVGTAGVGGHALTAVQQLHRMGCDAGLDQLTDQRLRHAVAVAIDLNVVVDVHAHGPKHSELPRLQTQLLQSRGIQIGKRAGSAAGQPLEGLAVEPIEQRGHGLVQIVHAGKPLVAQAHQDPALDNLHGRLGPGFVLGVARAYGQHRCAVVAGEVDDGVVGARLVPVGVGDHGSGVVGHDELGHAAKEAQGP